MIAYYMDENVHGAITKGLRQQGINVLRVQEDGYAGRTDPDVLDRATHLGRVLFSQDDDLLREATWRQRRWASFSGVIYYYSARLVLITAVVYSSLPLQIQGTLRCNTMRIKKIARLASVSKTWHI